MKLVKIRQDIYGKKTTESKTEGKTTKLTKETQNEVI